jgi:hypothetical protein
VRQNTQGYVFRGMSEAIVIAVYVVRCKTSGVVLGPEGPEREPAPY